MNQSNKDKEDRVKFLGYITPIITDYAENNQINPAVCYEVCHELELMMIEECKARGINGHELEKAQTSGRDKFQGIKGVIEERWWPLLIKEHFTLKSGTFRLFHSS